MQMASRIHAVQANVANTPDDTIARLLVAFFSHVCLNRLQFSSTFPTSIGLCCNHESDDCSIAMERSFPSRILGS